MNMELIDAYAEARHLHGSHLYSAETAAARDAVLACLRVRGAVPSGWAQGVEAVAKMLVKKADGFAEVHGHEDMGSLSFGQGAHAEAKMDWYSGLLELEEEVRSMLAAAPQPPAPQFIGELVEHRPMMDVVHNAARIDQETAHRVTVAVRAMHIP